MKCDKDGNIFVSKNSNVEYGDVTSSFVSKNSDIAFNTVSVSKNSDTACDTVSVSKNSDIACDTVSVSKNSDTACDTVSVSKNSDTACDTVSVSKNPDIACNTVYVSKNSDKDNTASSSTKHDEDIATLSNMESKSSCLLLPEPPERPLDSDCCGRGCTPCVMDIYYQEMALWEADCKMLKAGLSRDKCTPEQQEQILHPDQYAHFPIQEIKQEALDSLRIRCGLARHQSLGLSLGQHIIVRSQGPGPPLTRQYTPISTLDTKGYFELLIKIYPEGRMSQRVCAWTAGNNLEARGPVGHLEYVRNKFRRILMFCAGTGVAPMCPVISSVLADNAEETYLRLVYACRTYCHLVVKSEIDEWKRFWNFSCLFVLSQEPASPSYKYKIGDDIHKGRVTRDIVDRELDGRGDTTLVLVCGPQSFDTDITTYLTELGVPERNIHQY